MRTLYLQYIPEWNTAHKSGPARDDLPGDLLTEANGLTVPQLSLARSGAFSAALPLKIIS
jgi:hypothetical protein